MKKESILQKIYAYIPDNAVSKTTELLKENNVCLKISRQRLTKLGDYRSLNNGKIHAISVNENLNKYSFLITLIHELAHLKAKVNFGIRVKPHGIEWKNEFKQLMSWFQENDIFPEKILNEINRYMINPKASSNSDEKLALALRKYDDIKNGDILLIDLPENSVFLTKRGRKFKKGEKLRKRIICKEIKGGRFYLFSPIAEVFLEP